MTISEIPGPLPAEIEGDEDGDYHDRYSDTAIFDKFDYSKYLSVHDYVGEEVTE